MLIWGFDNNLDCLSPSSGMTAWVLYILSQLRCKQVALGGGRNQQVTGTWCSGVRWAPSMFTGLPMCWDSFNTSWRSKIKCRSETRLKRCIWWRIQVRFCFEMDFPHTQTYTDHCWMRLWPVFLTSIEDVDSLNEIGPWHFQFPFIHWQGPSGTNLRSLA